MTEWIIFIVLMLTYVSYAIITEHSCDDITYLSFANVT